MDHQITLSHVAKQYKVKDRLVPALSDISFSVENIGFLVLAGQSGSGKSTLLSLISGLEQPTSGQILIDGEDFTAMSGKAQADFRRRNIGVVFQQFYLEPTLTLRQNIELPAMFLNIPPRERAKRTAELAEMVGLSDRLDHLPTELSGGQIQRAAMLRAIYNHPKLLLADEPTSNLDPANTQTALDLFRQIRETFGTLVILATHDTKIAELADRVVRLENGRMINEI